MDDIGETKVSNGIFGVLTESKSKAVVFPPGVDTLEAFNRDVRFLSKLLGVRMNASGFGVVTFGDFEGDEAADRGVFQVWSLTQSYSVDFSQSRIGVKKCVFNKRSI